MPSSGKRLAITSQHSAISQTCFTAKVAKDAKKEGNLPFVFSFACFASVAVKLLLIAECWSLAALSR